MSLRLNEALPKYRKIYQNLSKFIKICQNLSKFYQSSFFKNLFCGTLSFLEFWALYKERSQKNISELENLKPEISSRMRFQRAKTLEQP